MQSVHVAGFQLLSLFLAHRPHPQLPFMAVRAVDDPFHLAPLAGVEVAGHAHQRGQQHHVVEEASGREHNALACRVVRERARAHRHCCPAHDRGRVQVDVSARGSHCQPSDHVSISATVSTKDSSDSAITMSSNVIRSSAGERCIGRRSWRARLRLARIGCRAARAGRRASGSGSRLST